MLEAVNRALEHSLSPDAVRWRVEAWRTGQSFSQIVLRHTLRYRVEQVFLIDEETGLPLQHVAAEAVDTQDSSLVSGMLTAIEKKTPGRPAPGAAAFGDAPPRRGHALRRGQRAPFPAGIDAFDATALADAPAPGIRSLAEAVERRTIRFAGGAAALAPGQEPALDALVADLRRLQAAAGEADRRVRLRILGHAGTEGDPSATHHTSMPR